MKFSERLQYKLRNYVYEANRLKKNKPDIKKSTFDEPSKKEPGQIKQVIDEMDEYLGELFQGFPHKKDNKWKN